MKKIYRRLLKSYGPQRWWPGDTPFEVMVGAVLTQNTAWTNVEKAIANLKANRCLDPAAIVAAPHHQLAEWLRPSGYFNIKATRLQNFCTWYMRAGGFDTLAKKPTKELRKALLSINGIGPETADDILLYAFDRPVFVIDAYTRRLFTRLGFIKGDEDYETLRELFEKRLGPDVAVYNEYHALIVAHAKYACRKKPLCRGCELEKVCGFGRAGSGRT